VAEGIATKPVGLGGASVIVSLDGSESIGGYRTTGEAF
jgi:hypothetical protein